MNLLEIAGILRVLARDSCRPELTGIEAVGQWASGESVGWCGAGSAGTLVSNPDAKLSPFVSYTLFQHQDGTHLTNSVKRFEPKLVSKAG